MPKQTLTPKSQDMSKWYVQAIQQAQLADYAPVKGCMVIRPNGYGIWEEVQRHFDPMLKEMNVQNAYFPLFIPMSFLSKEADHVEGFAPELAIVTHGGGEELEEKLAVRPTSETIMYDMYSKWIQSHRDLPLKLNQWNNVVRWEKRTYFFLRTTEFLWQEAHTAHATHDECWATVLEALEAYRTLVEEVLAIPVIKGRKSNSEKFAGAETTTTIEAMMPDGKALQAGTSHDLGQHFSQATAFDIHFQAADGSTEYVWQTSFGLSTRVIGALIMTHGDDEGVVIPPLVAPTQVQVVAAQHDDKVISACEALVGELKTIGVRAAYKNDTEHSLGWKLNQAEVEGVPLVLILGSRELEQGNVTAAIRHLGTKQTFPLGDVAKEIPASLTWIQQDLYQKAVARRDELMTEVETYDEFKAVMADKRGFIKAFWCEDSSCEKMIKDETKASTRCLPFIDNEGHVAEEQGTCIKCGKPATHRWLFAQAY